MPRLRFGLVFRISVVPISLPYPPRQLAYRNRRRRKAYNSNALGSSTVRHQNLRSRVYSIFGTTGVRFSGFGFSSSFPLDRFHLLPYTPRSNSTPSSWRGPRRRAAQHPKVRAWQACVHRGMGAFRGPPGEARQSPRSAPRSYATNLLLARVFFKREEAGDDNSEASGFIFFGSHSGDRRCRRFKCGTWQDGVRGSGIWSRPEVHEKKAPVGVGERRPMGP
jgi:hypothetical protein